MMSNDSGSCKRAVVVTLKTCDTGYAINLDDAVEMEVPGQWRSAEHITRKELSKQVIDELALSDDELAGLGYYILARLHAFKTMGEI